MSRMNCAPNIPYNSIKCINASENATQVSQEIFSHWTFPLCHRQQTYRTRAGERLHPHHGHGTRSHPPPLEGHWRRWPEHRRQLVLRSTDGKVGKSNQYRTGAFIQCFSKESYRISSRWPEPEQDQGRFHLSAHPRWRDCRQPQKIGCPFSLHCHPYDQWHPLGVYDRGVGDETEDSPWISKQQDRGKLSHESQ